MIKPEDIEKNQWLLFLEDIELGLEPYESALINRINLDELDEIQKVEVRRSGAIFKKKLLENIARDNSPKLSYDFYKLIMTLNKDKDLKKFKETVLKGFVDPTHSFFESINEIELFNKWCCYMEQNYSEAIDFKNLSSG